MLAVCFGAAAAAVLQAGKIVDRIDEIELPLGAVLRWLELANL